MVKQWKKYPVSNILDQLNPTANCMKDIKTRIAIAKKRMIDLHEIWRDKNIPVCLKMKLVKILVWSALLYGAESWTLLKADENRIMAAEMWFWRKMLNTKRGLLCKVITLKLGYLGHILRGSGSTLAATIIEGVVEGKRRRGRQKKQWFDNVKECTGLSYTETKRLAQNRQKWRQMIRRSAQMVANRQQVTAVDR